MFWDVKFLHRHRRKNNKMASKCRLVNSLQIRRIYHVNEGSKCAETTFRLQKTKKSPCHDNMTKAGFQNGILKYLFD